MKSIILSLLLFVGATVQAQQLSPNFLNEFTALLKANWAELKGKTKGEINDNFGYAAYYECKKPLKGFITRLVEFDDYEGHGTEVTAVYTGSDPSASQKVLDQIITELNKLQKNGYQIKQSSYNAGSIKKSVNVYYGTSSSSVAYINQFLTGEIEIHFPKTDDALTSATLNADFLNQFKAIFNAQWEDVKGNFTETVKADQVTYYTCKKPLSGFYLRTMEVAYDKSRFVQATRDSNEANVQFYAQIKTELSKLKNEGYSAKETLGGEIGEYALAKILSIGKGNNITATVSLYKDNFIEINFNVGKGNTGSAVSGRLSPDFIPQFKALFTAKWEAVKGDETGTDEAEGSVFYKSKLPLTGFVLDAIDLYNGDIKLVVGHRNAADSNVYYYEQMKTELEKLSGEGYIVKENLGNEKGYISKLLNIEHGDDGGVSISLLKDHTLEMIISIEVNNAAASAMKAPKVQKPNSFYNKKTGKTGFKDAKGNIVTPAKYDRVNYSDSYFSEGMLQVATGAGKKMKWGFVDSAGREVVAPQYDEVWKFSEGVAAVKSHNKWGGIDKTGKLVIPPQYSMAFHFSEGLAAVKIKDKWGYIDRSGKVVVPIQYTQAYDFKEGLGPVLQNKKWGYIHPSGAVAIPFQYMAAYSFAEGLAPVNVNGKAGFIDTTGKLVIEPLYESFYGFKDGLAMVKRNGKWGFVDKTGKEVVGLMYEDIFEFREGLAAAKLDGKWGFIDKSGEVVIPFQYELANYFENGKASVKLNGSFIKINKRGKTVK